MNYSVDGELSSKNSFETVLAVRTRFYTIETIDKKVIKILSISLFVGYKNYGYSYRQNDVLFNTKTCLFFLARLSQCLYLFHFEKGSKNRNDRSFHVEYSTFLRYDISL